MIDNNNKYSISKDEDATIPFGYQSAKGLAYNKADAFDSLVNHDLLKETQSKKQKKPKAPPKDSRKEELKRLYQSLYEEDKKYEKAKGRRTIVTILVFTAFYFWLIWQFTDSFAAIVPAIPLAVIHFFANATIFGQLSDMGRNENKRLEFIREQIKELEKEIYK